MQNVTNFLLLLSYPKNHPLNLFLVPLGLLSPNLPPTTLGKGPLSPSPTPSPPPQSLRNVSELSSHTPSQAIFMLGKSSLKVQSFRVYPVSSSLQTTPSPALSPTAVLPKQIKLLKEHPNLHPALLSQSTLTPLQSSGLSRSPSLLSLESECRRSFNEKTEFGTALGNEFYFSGERQNEEVDVGGVFLKHDILLELTEGQTRQNWFAEFIEDTVKKSRRLERRGCLGGRRQKEKLFDERKR